MEKIKIITDSTADLPKEIFEKYDVEVLPLLINFGEESYLDGVDINLQQLIKRINEENVLPTTAQVTPNRFAECYKKQRKNANCLRSGVLFPSWGSCKNVMNQK